MENKVIKEKYIEKGERFKVSFSGYTHEGLAIARIDGKDRQGNEYTNFPLFVFGALDKEQGFVEITKMSKTYAYATMLRLFDENHSSYRNKPICPKYSECGGCNIMHMTYKGQLEFKEQMVKDTLKKLGGFSDIDVEPVEGMSNGNLYYRNKVQVPVGCVKGKTLCGFYKRETHDIIPLDECFIQTEYSTNIVKFVKNVLTEFGATGYNEKFDKGDIRHILVRKNNNDTEYMVVLIVKSLDFMKKKDLDAAINKIINRYPKVVSVILNLNDKKGNTILGEKCVTVYGKDTITDELCGCKFNIGAKSFYQVNYDQCEKLYSIAIEKAQLGKEDVVIDAYCGSGTIGIIASKKVKYVYGVEIVDEAIKNAKANSILNNSKNTEFVCAKAEEQIIKWMEKEIKPNVIFVDPPRKGCDKKFIDTIISMKIKKVIYVSCDPSTLARDARILVDNNYVVKYIKPVDLFAHSSHIDTIMCFELAE